MEEERGLRLFAEEVAKGEAADLGRASLLIGMLVRADLDVDPYLARLDELGLEARARSLSPVETIASLFGPDGFRGNQLDYYDPRNSFLHEVLDRRLGIPISLSVLAIEVGRRAGVRVEGVPFPGHFLVRVRSRAGAALLDPFAGAQPVGDEELLARMRAVLGRIGSLGPEELGPASKRKILGRMLQNLKLIYLRAEELKSALAVEERLVLLWPEDVEERRDRGLLYARLGRPDEAEADLRHYLRERPAARDGEAVRKVADHLRKLRGPEN